MVEILIVEDDPNIARTIEVTISLVGYECRICGDGAAAVQEVLEHDYDLVLLDVMPVSYTHLTLPTTERV